MDSVAIRGSGALERPRCFTRMSGGALLVKWCIRCLRLPNSRAGWHVSARQVMGSIERPQGTAVPPCPIAKLSWNLCLLGIATQQIICLSRFSPLSHSIPRGSKYLLSIHSPRLHPPGPCCVVVGLGPGALDLGPCHPRSLPTGWVMVS